MWYWVIPAWVASLIVVFILGYEWRSMKNTIAVLEQEVKNKMDKPAPEPEPESTVIDPLDPIQNAIYEHNVMMEKLNGK